MKKAVLVLITLVLAAAPAAMAQRAPQQEMFPEISTAEVKEMVDGGENFFLVDARTAEEYAQGHIPGAVNIPPGKFRFIAGLLPKNKSIPVVFYCRGYG
ncbi:MAG: rhodanese-like domain-containing protein [Nitrospirota bacterium]|jgi:rhodanese-related sulfurtransferase